MMNLRRLLNCSVASLCLLASGARAQELLGVSLSERDVLLALYTNTNGAGWTTRTNWNGPRGTECTWYGVVCNSAGTTVNVVSLPNNNLVGTLPAHLNNLPNLGIFDVSGNQLTGTIPALTGLSGLGNFNVIDNQLTGAIPALTGLTELRNFIASNNQLTGTIPSLTDLTNLSFFHVANNHLTGSIPTLDDLTHLMGFNVAGNQLTGRVPSIPTPSLLQTGRSTLCPNFLTHTPDAAWDAATGQTPWYTNCPIVPQVGLWWNPAESGTGYALDFKHGVLVVTVYSYTASGAPIWYLASGPVTNNVFTATLDKYQTGQCVSCAYQPPTTNGNDGVVSIFFASPTSATMTLPGGRNFTIVPQDF